MVFVVVDGGGFCCWGWWFLLGELLEEFRIKTGNKVIVLKCPIDFTLIFNFYEVEFTMFCETTSQLHSYIKCCQLL